MSIELDLIKSQFEMVKYTETFVMITDTAKWLIEQAEKAEELQNRIDKVLEQSGVIWINRTLKGE